MDDDQYNSLVSDIREKFKIMANELPVVDYDGLESKGIILKYGSQYKVIKDKELPTVLREFCTPKKIGSSWFLVLKKPTKTFLKNLAKFK